MHLLHQTQCNCNTFLNDIFLRCDIKTNCSQLPSVIVYILCTSNLMPNSMVKFNVRGFMNFSRIFISLQVWIQVNFYQQSFTIFERLHPQLDAFVAETLNLSLFDFALFVSLRKKQILSYQDIESLTLCRSIVCISNYLSFFVFSPLLFWIPAQK